MKKLLSLGLVAAMAVSAMPMAYATTDVSNGTEVEYLGSKTTIDGEGNEVYAEAYTVTVPAKMAPGGSAFVKAEGTWNSARKLVVTADKTVELENNINTSDKKTLDVTFNGINLVGDNNVAVANYGDGVEGEPIAVGNIENALFGTWSGVFEYQVEMVDNIPVEMITFTIHDSIIAEDSTFQAEKGMTWSQWVNSQYSVDSGFTFNEMNFTSTFTINENNEVIRTHYRDGEYNYESPLMLTIDEEVGWEAALANDVIVANAIYEEPTQGG